MLGDDMIAQQQELLRIQRQTLATYLQQHAAMGSAHVPPAVIHGIRESRAAIQHIKATLRDWGVAVDDYPDDVARATPAEAAGAPTGAQHNTSTFNLREPESAAMGDTISISNISGSNVNVKSTLEHVTQTINAFPGDPGVKNELQQLIEQLNTELRKAPANKQADAEAVAEIAKDLVDRAAKEKPNRAIVQISAEGLKQAAANLDAVLPTVLPIATKIATTILRLAA
ncbi:MAG TPA: hypothetical protein VFU22_14540 [Roseiflexaceae bacterium]|nr:hypothetical protein [Roseiflexaceae bacterium]